MTGLQRTKPIVSTAHQRLIETASGPVEFRLTGTGPTVVVLNGGHCSRESRFSHEGLAACGFSVLTPSRPGYDSTPLTAGKTPEAAADMLANLFDELHISTVDLIGISAAGPTALAFAMQHPHRLRKLILESAIALPWDEKLKKRSRFLFGRFEKVIWLMARLALKIAPVLTVQAMIEELTTLEAKSVVQRLSPEDFHFVCEMIRASQSGTGFVNDIEHRIDQPIDITAPVLAMYSPYDKTVPPIHAERIAKEVQQCELYEVPSDTHLIWIGASEEAVWQKRLSFLQASVASISRDVCT